MQVLSRKGLRDICEPRFAEEKCSFLFILVRLLKKVKRKCSHSNIHVRKIFIKSLAHPHCLYVIHKLFSGNWSNCHLAQHSRVCYYMKGKRSK